MALMYAEDVPIAITDTDALPNASCSIAVYYVDPFRAHAQGQQELTISAASTKNIFMHAKNPKLSPYERSKAMNFRVKFQAIVHSKPSVTDNQ